MTSTSLPVVTDTQPAQSTDVETQPAGDPPMLRYHDGAGKLREIFLPIGTYNNAISLLESENWGALSKFSPWSDQPALEPMQPNQMSYVDKRTGEHRQIFLPLGKLARAGELLVAEDWAGLETEFEPWKGQVREDAEVVRKHQEGVERIARGREAEESAHRASA